MVLSIGKKINVAGIGSSPKIGYQGVHRQKLFEDFNKLKKMSPKKLNFLYVVALDLTNKKTNQLVIAACTV